MLWLIIQDRLHIPCIYFVVFQFKVTLHMKVSCWAQHKDLQSDFKERLGRETLTIILPSQALSFDALLPFACWQLWSAGWDPSRVNALFVNVSLHVCALCASSFSHVTTWTAVSLTVMQHGHKTWIHTGACLPLLLLLLRLVLPPIL